MHVQPVAAQTAITPNPPPPGQPASAVLSGTARLIAPYDPSQMMRIVFALQPPHLAEEKQFVQDVHTKGNPLFHQFLTQWQWIERFAPAVEDEQAVVNWAQSQGFTVTNRYPNRMIVNVEAPVGTIQKALQVQINQYSAGGSTFYSNDRAPSIPANLIVQEVLGLNSMAMLQPMLTGGHASEPAYVPGPFLTRGQSHHVSASASKPADKTSRPMITNGYLDPTDIYSSNAYDYNALSNLGHCCNPTGNPNGPTPVTSIGIATAYDININDFNGFQAQYSYLATNLDQVFIGGQVTCPSNNLSCNEETTLDLEWSTATSNSFGSYLDSAAIWAYEGSDSLSSTFLSIYNQMLADDYVRVVSISWGASEGADGSGTINAMDSAFLQMVGEGWSIFAASGDNGATTGCGPQDAVTYPASDPNVTAVGGTTLELYSDGAYASEVGWTGGTASGSCASNHGGSGGGISSSFTTAPSYQIPLGFAHRQVPDVALNASIGQNIFYNGALTGVIGTSVATPEMAGFLAQANAYLLSLGNICGNGQEYPCAPVGNANYPFYGAGTDPSFAPHYPFYDIVGGCNSNDITALFGLGYYCAGPGWDAVTGWGSSNMLQLSWLLNSYFTRDNGEPVIAFSGPAINEWYNKDETVSWTVFDTSEGGNPQIGIAGYSAEWDVDPGDPSSEKYPGTGSSFYSGPQYPNATAGSLDFTGSGVSQACHTVNVRAWDNAGVATYDYTYGPVCYDTIAPVTTVQYSGTVSGSSYVGSVKITLQATDNASGVASTVYRLDNGAAALYSGPFTVSSVGSHTLTFHSVDVAGNIESSHTSTFSIIAETTTAITSSLNPSTYCASVTFTATVTSTAGTPTGTVKFYSSGTLIGSATLSGGVATFTTASLAAGGHSMTAVYEGATKFAGSTSPALTQTVKPAATTTSVTSSLNPSGLGQPVTFTAKVTSPCGTPTGTVSFYNGSNSLGSETLSGGVASLTISTLTSGTHKITASYGGATDFGTSSGSLTQTVGTTGATTSTTVVSSEPYNPYGHAITLTATVTAGTGTPTGTVTFYNNGTALGTENLSNGTAVLTTSTLPAGTDTITATYNGASGFAPSTSGPLTQITLGVYTVGNDPLLLVSDGANMWVSNNASNTVSKVQQSTGTVLNTVAVGEHPEGVAFDGTNIWVANYGSNNVSVVNASTASVVATYAAGMYPGALAYDGSHIWVVSFGVNTLTELNKSNGTVVNTYTFGSANIGLGGVLFDGTNIWVTVGSTNTVEKILASTGAIEGAFNAGVSPGTMTFDGTYLWIANYGSNALTKILASNGTLEGTVSVSNPSGLTFDGTNLWVSNYQSSTLTEINASNGSSLGTFQVGEGPVGLAFDGTNVWVAVSVTDTICKL
jgi:YVTN family beta-propeller protein